MTEASDDKKKETKKASGSYDQSQADKWSDRYDTAKNHQIKQMQRFADWYDDMYAVMNTTDYAPWRSKIFIPILSSKAWSLISKFLEVKPGYQVKIRDENLGSDELEALAEKIQRKLAQDYDNPDLDESIRSKLLGPLLDAVVTGQGLAKVPYVFQNKVRYTWPTTEDGEDVVRDKRIKTTTRVGYNDLIPVSVFNFFPSPSAKTFYTAPWIIIREYKPLSELEATNAAKGVEVYKNLELLKGIRADSNELSQYERSRNRMVSSDDPLTVDDTVDEVEIFECYEKATNKLCTYAASGASDKNKGDKSDWILIREQVNPYWHGKYPLVPFYIKKKPFTIWGEGIFEVSQRLQSAVNDVINHYMDNFNLSVDGMVMIDEDSQVEEYLVQPGGELVYRGNPPTPFKFPEPNPSQVSLVMGTLKESIEDVTISPYAQGSGNAGNDNTQGTATGIIRLQEAAGDIISFMRTNFQDSIRQVGIFWLSNNQQFFTGKAEIAVSEGGVDSTIQVNPADFQYEMELTVDDASMQPMSKQEQRENYLLFVAQLLSMQKASIEQATTQQGTEPLTIDFVRLTSEMADKFGFKNSTRFFQAGELSPATQMAAQGVDPAQAQASAEQGMMEQGQMPDLSAMQPAPEGPPVAGSLQPGEPLPPGAAGGLA